MPRAAPFSAPTAVPNRPLRLGFLSLTDAAPLFVAQELGYFASRGLRVELHREIGWATIREKITALVQSLAEAAVWCDEPHHRAPLAEMLAGARFLNLPARVLTPALLGPFDCGHGRIVDVPDFLGFSRADAGAPTVEKAGALQRHLGAAQLISAARAADHDLPRRLFREDLHRAFLPNHRENTLQRPFESPTSAL